MKRKTAKELLADSFRELAETKTIDKITIKDITDNCGYSSATFYRQFRDKYDLIAWAYSRDLKQIMARVDEVSWEQALSDAAHYYGEHREYLANLLMHTIGYDSFLQNMMEIHNAALSACVRRSAGQNALGDMLSMLIRGYVFSTVHLTCEWILGKYAVDAEHLAEVYARSLPADLQPYLSEK